MKSFSIKKLIPIFLLLFSISLGAHANTTMVLHSNSGDVVRYSFNEHPTMSFNGKETIIKTDEVEISYAMSEYSEVTFEDGASGIEEVVNSHNNSTSTLVYDINGHLLKRYANILDYSSLKLTKGIYIIKTGNTTIKLSTK